MITRIQYKRQNEERYRGDWLIPGTDRGGYTYGPCRYVYEKEGEYIEIDEAIDQGLVIPCRAKVQYGKAYTDLVLWRTEKGFDHGHGLIVLDDQGKEFLIDKETYEKVRFQKWEVREPLPMGWAHENISEVSDYLALADKFAEANRVSETTSHGRTYNRPITVYNQDDEKVVLVQEIRVRIIYDGKTVDENIVKRPVWKAGRFSKKKYSTWNKKWYYVTYRDRMEPIGEVTSADVISWAESVQETQEGLIFIKKEEK